MKKIASLFASIKIGGGVEKVQSNLSIAITKLGYDFYHILSEDISPKHEYAGKITSLHSPFVMGFGPKKILSLFKDAFHTARICKQEKIDILLGQWDYFYMVSGLTRLFGFRGKTIAVVHTTIGIWPKPINRILRFFLGLHDKIVLISNEEKETFETEYGFDPKKLTVIYNSISFENIDNLATESVDDLNFEKFTFINIGRLTYQKWQERLLRAFDLFHENHPDSQLIILGEWELRAELSALQDTLGAKNDIHLLGNKSNVYKYLAKSDCFVLSSRFEGFPMVLIEAMGIGTLIISTDCQTGPKELFEYNEQAWFSHGTQKTKYGYLLQDDEQVIQNIVQAMTEEYTNPTNEYDYMEMRNRFSPEQSSVKWDELIQNL